jgi:hypothetical protein
MKKIIAIALVLGSFSTFAAETAEESKCNKDLVLKNVEFYTDLLMDAYMNNADELKALNASEAVGVELKKATAKFCKTVYGK